MKLEKALELVFCELERAETLHPAWPADLVKRAAIICEEAGEVIQAANNFDEKKGSKKTLITEVVHVAACALRFLKNIEEINKNE